MSSLPPFLTPLASATPFGDASYCEASFCHDVASTVAGVHWYPSSRAPKTVLFFLPGNPGLLAFYVDFLSSIHAAQGHDLVIFAHSYLGHTPSLHAQALGSAGLTAQVEAAIRAFDAVREWYDSSVAIVVAGHSVGSWVALQVLKARGSAVSKLILLFPTLCDISMTPNGRRLSWLFRPSVRCVVSVAARFLPQILSAAILDLLFRDWPLVQRHALHSLIASPHTILATLLMAHDEMNIINDLDRPLISANQERMYFYFGEQDDWVGHNRAVLMRHLGEEGYPRIAIGAVPHAFCIKESHVVVDQIVDWMR